MPQLRIGLIAADWRKIEPWVHRLLAMIEACDELAITHLIEHDLSRSVPKTNMLYRVIRIFEKPLFAQAISADTQSLERIRQKTSLSSDEQFAGVDDNSCDVMICVDGCADEQASIPIPRHGLWSLDIFSQPAQAICFDAVCGRAAVADIHLNAKMVAGKPAETIAIASINPKFNLARNTLFMKEKAVVLIVRELRRAARGQKPAPLERLDTQPDVGTVDVIGYIGHILGTFVAKVVKAGRKKFGINPEQFVLLTGEGEITSFDPKQTSVLVPPGSDFWADPFLWEKDGETYCFYEHFSRHTKRGHIQVGRLEGGNMIVVGDALISDTHLSYPFLFEHKNELYMMPETCAAKRIEIWRCTDFPLQWELHSTGLEGKIAADSTIVQRDGMWWLFTNIATDVYRDSCSELHIFEIDGPDLKVMKPHVDNPVNMDSRSARNAGRFHDIDGRLYRPSQDNAYGQYGYGLNIMEVTDLSPKAYREKRVHRVDPKFDPRFKACHHFDALNGRFIIDAMKISSQK